MSRAETLAGLTEAIDKVIDRWGDTLPTADSVPVHAQIAEAALAWLEGHGWAEGAWQYGVLWDGAGPDGVLDMDDEAMAYEVMPDGVVRRIVTAWAPVETGEDA